MFELIVLLSRYFFIFYAVYFLWQALAYILSERKILKIKLSLALAKQRVAIVFMHLTAFLLLAYEPEGFPLNIQTLIIGTVGLVLILLGQVAANRIFKNSCQLIWNAVFFLFDIGLIMIQRLDSSFAIKQMIWFSVGFGLMLLMPTVLWLIPKIEKLKWFYLIIGLGLLVSPLIIGRVVYGATNWISIGDFNLQPSEIVKFLFVFFLGSVFYNSVSFADILFSGGMSALFVLILVIQRDLGGALIFFMTFLVVLYIASGKKLLCISGLGLAGVAAYLSYFFFDHVKVRVAAWLDPWSDIDVGGYQIVHSLFAIGTWGLLGSGLTRGMPEKIPVVVSDFIFSAICEEFGGIFGMTLVGVFILMFYRCVHIALRSNNRLHCLLAAGFTALLSFQTFLILGGVIKMIPLTGVTLPFVSYGGSSIVVSMLIIGILQWLYQEQKKSSG